jgi:hypothetical protein
LSEHQFDARLNTIVAGRSKGRFAEFKNQQIMELKPPVLASSIATSASSGVPVIAPVAGALVRPSHRFRDDVLG